MSFTQQATTASGRTKTVIAKTTAQLAIAVAIVQAETDPTYPNINNSSDGNKFVTRYAAFPNKVK